MKKSLFAILIVLFFWISAWGGQTFTNSDLRKYDRYKSSTNTNNYRPATKYEHYSTSPSTTSTASSTSAHRKRCNDKILLANEELRKIERQIKDLERKIQFHSKMKDSREVTNTCRTEIKKLHDRSKSIQNNINDLNLLQAGADPDQVMSNRQAARNAERAQEVRDKKDFNEGFNDAIAGIPPKSYSGEYYIGYRSQVTNSYSYGKSKEHHPNIINGEWDDRGNHYSSAGGGNAWRSDGTFMQKTGGGYIDTKTGQFIPAH